MRYILFFIVTFLFASCKDDSQVEVNRMMFIAPWEVTEEYAKYDQDGNLDFEVTRNFNFEINPEGMAFKNAGGQIDTLEWYYQYNPEKLVLVDRVIGLISNTWSFEVGKLTENEIELITAYDEFQQGGDIFTIESRWFLTK